MAALGPAFSHHAVYRRTRPPISRDAARWRSGGLRDTGHGAALACLRVLTCRNTIYFPFSEASETAETGTLIIDNGIDNATCLERLPWTELRFPGPSRGGGEHFFAAIDKAGLRRGEGFPA